MRKKQIIKDEIRNPNHPKKGSTIMVEPIKSKKDIKAIKLLLANKPLDLALFTVGINTNLRASDLLSLKVEQVNHLTPMQEIILREKKTKKDRRISLNSACIEAMQNLLKSKKLKDEDFLFTGKFGTVILTPSLNLKVKSWTSAIRLKGNYGSHSLRKTWGYHQRQAGADIPTLMECFNHSTQKQTLTYLCIQPDEIKNIYANVI